MMRVEPLGLDRRHNRYWRFTPLRDSSPPDPCAGRLFIEDGHDGHWLLLDSAEQLEGLRGALDPRGAREMELVAELERLREELAKAMPAPPLTLHSPSPGSPAEAPLAMTRMQAEQYLPPGWEPPEVSSSGQEDRRLAEIKLCLLQMEAALPTSALVADAFER